MSNPFLAEIRIFAGNFAPNGWALCNGQLLSIAQNSALFALLGTTYGGDGRTTFALPNLQGSVPMHAGDGPGLTSRVLGEVGGEDAVTLLASETPSHTHTAVVNATAGAATSNSPVGETWAPSPGPAVYAPLPAVGQEVSMGSGFTDGGPGGLPHNNLQPYLTLTFIIALQGVFPARP